MKKFVILLLAVAAGVYGIAAINLSEAGANRFLNELEDLTISGRGEEYCARLHDDLSVSIRDHSARPPADFDGGRDDYCNYVRQATKGADLLGLGFQVTRDDFTVTRSWLHPWTAHVKYSEERITTMSRVNFSLHTAGEDELTLVQTLGGVKLLRLKSSTWRVEQ
jgi:hypothetical protein